MREVDRLARNRFKQMAVENDLQAQGVKVEYAIGQYADTAEGRLLKGLMSEFAEYEREKIKQRTTRGKLRSSQAGNVTTGGSKAPYGYDLVTRNGKRVLVINEAEAAGVRLIFDLYVNQRSSLYGVADYLGAHNVPKPAKGNNHKQRSKLAAWSVGTINKILDNETYVGRWYYRKTKRVKQPDGRYKNVPRPRNEWILIEVPAIIEEHVFEAVQARREANKRQMGKNRKYTYLLGGMVKCGHCGNGVSGMAKEKWRYYKCNARHLPKKYGFRCELPQFKCQDVDAAVWGWVRGILLDPDRLQSELAKLQTEQAQASAPLIGMIEANEAKLTDLTAQRQRIIKAYRVEALTLDEFAQEKAAIDKRITDLTAAIESLQGELAPHILTPEKIASIETMAADVRAGLADVDNDQAAQREILILLDTAVTLYFVDGRKELDIVCTVGEGKLSEDNTTLDYSGPAWKRSASSCGVRPYTALWQTARQTYWMRQYNAPCPPSPHRAAPPSSPQSACGNPSDESGTNPRNPSPGGAGNCQYHP